MNWKAWLITLGASLTLGTALAQAPAADWPSKTVKILVPYAPGGSSDTLGRIIAQHLQTQLKQSFVVENRAGGGGTIGSAAVAKNAPDGYSLVVSGIGSHVIAPATVKVFNPMDDFSHIALLGGPPTVLVVHPSVPANSVPEFITWVQGLKQGLSWGSPGPGTHGHMVGEMFARQTKISQTHIGYKGAAPAVTDLVSGQVLAAFVTFSSANAFIASGRIKALGVTSIKRMADIPSVPTFAELGYPDLTATTWFAISGPAGMPAPLVRKINEEIRRAQKSEPVLKLMAAEGMETQDLDPAQFTRFVGQEIQRWAPLVQAIEKSKPN